MTYANLKTIKEKEQFIKEQLASNDNWVLRGLLAIWNKQTADEKMTKDTKHHNGVGFTGSDAEFYTAMADRVNSGYSLSVRQMECIRKGMKKYAGQLRRIADGVI